MWTLTSDGSVTDGDGKIIAYSREKFISDVCLGDCCFICGAAPGTRPFNNEHILPEWMLREYDLFDRFITLPNGTRMRYDQYTVPCCRHCNEEMGRRFETPISAVAKGGLDAFEQHLQDDVGVLRMYSWMGLIFLKTHLKDAMLRAHQDNRLGLAKISEEYEYEWDDFQHLHNVVRSFHTGARVHREAIGSLIVLPAKSVVSPDRFDYGDLYMTQSMMLRLGETLLIAVFNDSNAAAIAIRPKIQRIAGSLSELQARELLVDCAMANLHIKHRPEFRMDTDVAAESAEIVAIHPASLEFNEYDRESRGKLMHHANARYFAHLAAAGFPDAELEEHIKTGHVSFILDNEGKFMDHEPPPLAQGSADIR